jgi:PAS domain-containing protein
LPGAIQRVLAVLKARTESDAVGIRLQDGDDFPYFTQEGFSEDFLRTENTLVARNAAGGICRNADGSVCLECTCGLVISGKTDPANPFFTRGGSCWTNDSIPLVDFLAIEDLRLHPRNRCIHDGYASVALVPIRNKDSVVGLIQLNDRRKGRFTLETVESLEGIAAHIGAALMRGQAEDALQQAHDELEQRVAERTGELRQANEKLQTEITEHNRTEETLKRSETLLRITQRLTATGGWNWDVEKQTMFWTEETYRIHEFEPREFVPGTSEHFARSLNCYRPEDRPVILDAFRRCAEEGQPYDLEFLFTTAKGRQLWIRTAAEPRVETGKIVGMAGFICDITARKQAEAEKEKLEVQNRQLQKSESLGRMAGAIAHHFNNQLQAVMLSLEMATSTLPRNAEPIDGLSEAMQSARKAAEVSTLMLTYLGHSQGKHEPLDLAEVCRRSLVLLRAALPRSVVWETDLPAPGPGIRANASQVQQVLTNLVSNASEASGDGRGVIRLSVKTVAVADIPTARRFPIDYRPQQKTYACLEGRTRAAGSRPRTSTNSSIRFSPPSSPAVALVCLSFWVLRGHTTGSSPWRASLAGEVHSGSFFR